MDSPLVSSLEMRAAEEAAFARGVKAEALMDEAGAGIAEIVQKFFPQPATCFVFVGKGHNGGDALVAARSLKRAGWKIEPRLAFEEGDCDDLTRKKLRYLRETSPDSRSQHPAGQSSARSPCHAVALDGLLGLGAKPPLREPIRSACREINRLRREEDVFVFAVDLPSGIEGDSGDADTDCVVADFTIAIGLAKKGLVADRATNFVGRLEVVELSALRRDEVAPLSGRAAGRPSETVATAASLRGLLPRRGFDVHKNQFGRIGVVAGSKGFTGAALMCSLGALRAGAGLVELFVPDEIYPVVAAAAAPETMVKTITSYRSLLQAPVDVWAVGPGLGKNHAQEVLGLIVRAEKPMVVDADGLNILSGKPEALLGCAEPRLLTPHPGEMKRLFPKNELSRARLVTAFCEQYPVTLLLKGSRTLVGERDHPHSYNITGNPGMATGGMGDVLTGVCAALIGQERSLYDSARLGAWLCGRAAEIAITQAGASEESLLPSDVIANLGGAFIALRAGG